MESRHHRWQPFQTHSGRHHQTQTQTMGNISPNTIQFTASLVNCLSFYLVSLMVLLLVASVSSVTTGTVTTTAAIATTTSTTQTAAARVTSDEQMTVENENDKDKGETKNQLCCR